MKAAGASQKEHGKMLDQTPKGKSGSVKIDNGILTRVRKLARAERRSLKAMIEMLIEDSMRTRKEHGSATIQK